MLFEFPKELVRNTRFVKFVPTQDGILAFVRSRSVLTSLLQYPSKLVQSTDGLVFEAKLRKGRNFNLNSPDIRVIHFKNNVDHLSVKFRILRGGDNVWKFFENLETEI